MGSIQEATNAINKLNRLKVNGKLMWVKFSKPRIQKEEENERSSERQDDAFKTSKIMVSKIEKTTKTDLFITPLSPSNQI